MSEHSNEVRIALLKQRIQQLEAERDNALPFYKTRLAKAREAMIQMENEIAKLKLALESRNRERDALAEALQEMRYGHTDKAEKMAIKALKYLAK